MNNLISTKCLIDRDVYLGHNLCLGMSLIKSNAMFTWQIKHTINTSLAEEVKQLTPDSELTLCIVKQLGSRFLNEYLTNQDIDQRKLQAVRDNKDIQLQAQTWLSEKLAEIVKYSRLKGIDKDVNNEEMSSDMMEYFEFVSQVVYRGMDRELALTEKKQLNLVKIY